MFLFNSNILIISIVVLPQKCSVLFCTGNNNNRARIHVIMLSSMYLPVHKKCGYICWIMLIFIGLLVILSINRVCAKCMCITRHSHWRIEHILMQLSVAFKNCFHFNAHRNHTLYHSFNIDRSVSQYKSYKSCFM